MKKKKKRSIVPVLILFVLLACLAAGFFFLFPRISFKDGERVYEKGEIYPADSVVVKAHGTLTPENDVLDTAAVGEHHFRYTVKKLFFTRELDFVYEVVDTTPPKIEIRESTVYRDPGETYTEEEMRANITVDEGTLSFSTDYDPQYSGTYTVFVHAVDDSGNESDASSAGFTCREAGLATALRAAAERPSREFAEREHAAAGLLARALRTATLTSPPESSIFISYDA